MRSESKERSCKRGERLDHRRQICRYQLQNECNRCRGSNRFHRFVPQSLFACAGIIIYKDKNRSRDRKVSAFRLKINNVFCHKKSKKGFTNDFFCGILDGSKFIGGIFGFPTLQFANPAISDLFFRWALFFANWAEAERPRDFQKI